MNTVLIKNATVVNEGLQEIKDVLIVGEKIKKIGVNLNINADQVIDATGKHLIPGLIDDQVHFREPGLTHKATIESESRAAVAGGITSFIEMPNTNPQTINIEALAEKALKHGFISEIADTNQLDDAIEILTQSLLKNGPEALQKTKALVFEVAQKEIDQKLIDFTADSIAQVRSSPEAKEGLSAFLEKRKPLWNNP